MNKHQTATSYRIISRRAIEADQERVLPTETAGKSWFASLFPMFEWSLHAR